MLPPTALAVAPQLKDLEPTGAQRGTELEVRFLGGRLQDTEEIFCYEPGVQVLKLNRITNNVVKALIKVLPECGLGEHHLRVRTATGASELRTFLVGPFPVIEEIEPNNEPAKAQKVPLNTTVSGVIKSEDVDCFAVELKQGQRFSVEVEGMRLGRGLFDSRLAVLDGKGAVLADVDDTWLTMQDPFVSLLAPHDGIYTIKLREAAYGGNDNCHYRLHIGSFPRPATVFPLGGPAGETLALTCFTGLKGTGPEGGEAPALFVQQVKLPAMPQDRFGVFPELDGLPAPTPNWLRVSPFPNVLAAAPNQDRDHATAAGRPPPFALNGVLGKRGQEDWFAFPANKGTALAVTVYARRLRSPLDSELEVFDAKGRQVAANDDAGSADSALKFTPAETTNYFVRIRDTLGQGGRDFAYRIEVTPAAPAVEVKIPDVARNDTQSRQCITVPQGNRFATLISAKRANFSGDLEFAVPDLPPGVTLLADRLARNLEAMPLVFEAAADAPIGSRLLDLTATGTNGTETATGRFHQDIDLVEGPPNNATYYAIRIDKCCVAVTKPAPFHLRVVEPKVPLVQAGSMGLEVVAERAPGFDAPIDVQMVWNPPGVSSESTATIAQGATNVFYRLNANGGAEKRVWKIAILGHATVEGGPLYVSSQLANLEVAAPYLTGKIETLWLEPGKSGKLTVSLQQEKPFEGKATIRLGGLPDKVSAPPQEFTKDNPEVVFDVSAAPNCPPGMFKNLFCAVEVKANGQVIPHTIAQGGILRVVRPRAFTSAK